LVLDNVEDPAALHEPIGREWVPARLAQQLAYRA
jgi:hypothetical protein